MHKFILRFPSSWTLEDGICPSRFGKPVSHSCFHKYFSTRYASKKWSFQRRVSENSVPQAFLILIVLINLRVCWINLQFSNTDCYYKPLIPTVRFTRELWTWNNSVNREGNGKKMEMILRQDSSVKWVVHGKNFRWKGFFFVLRKLNNLKYFKTKWNFFWLTIHRSLSLVLH